MIRAVLLWLLVLALPAQGAIAATMLYCGPNSLGRTAPIGVAHVADDPPGSHDHAMRAHAGAADAKAGMAASDEAASSDVGTQADLQTCSVCASCCSAAALHDAVPKLSIVETVTAGFVAPVPTVEPFETGGPDRPPRSFLT